MVVVHEVGVELVGLTVEETIETIESALKRPLVKGSSSARVGHRAQVPLPQCERGVSAVTKNLGDCGRVVRDVASHVREARVEVGDGAHADRVVVAPRQQRRSCRTAQWGDVEVRVAQALGGKSVDVGRIDGRAVATQMRETHVVEEHHDDIRC